MEIIKPSFQILAMTGHPELPYQYQPNPELLIEACGRTPYKSEDKISEGSARKFVEMIEKRKHYTVLEHSWEVRQYNHGSMSPLTMSGNWSKYLYISNAIRQSNQTIISGNSRAFKEAARIEPALELATHCNFPDNRIAILAREAMEPFLMSATVRFINDRGVAMEQVRHRPMVVSMESTRYVNYSKRGMQVILPLWIEPGSSAEGIWEDQMKSAEMAYNALLYCSWTPQQARSVLPNSLKTELCITAPLSEWQHIFRQRALSLMGKAHEQMEEIMIPCWNEFAKLEPTFFSEDIL